MNDASRRDISFAIWGFFHVKEVVGSPIYLQIHDWWKLDWYVIELIEVSQLLKNSKKNFQKFSKLLEVRNCDFLEQFKKIYTSLYDQTDHVQFKNILKFLTTLEKPKFKFRTFSKSSSAAQLVTIGKNKSNMT